MPKGFLYDHDLVEAHHELEFVHELSHGSLTVSVDRYTRTQFQPKSEQGT